MSEETKGGCQVWVRGPWWLLVVGEGIKVELSVAEGPSSRSKRAHPTGPRRRAVERLKLLVIYNAHS